MLVYFIKPKLNANKVIYYLPFLNHNLIVAIEFLKKVANFFDLFSQVKQYLTLARAVKTLLI